MARDFYHQIVREALEADGWTITADPYYLDVGNDSPVEIDIGAEKLISAERGTEKIVVEIKSFLNRIMEKVNNYRTIIKNIFKEYASTRIPVNDSNPGYQLIFDDPNNHYLLYRTSWKEGLRRVHFCVFHIDIINDKLWVQEDATDFDLVGVLEENNIPKEDIVLAFHAPYKRPYTGYAVA